MWNYKSLFVLVNLIYQVFHIHFPTTSFCSSIQTQCTTNLLPLDALLTLAMLNAACKRLRWDPASFPQNNTSVLRDTASSTSHRFRDTGLHPQSYKCCQQTKCKKKEGSNTSYFTPRTTDKVNLKLICTNDKVQIDLCQVNENFLRNISSFCDVWMINMNSSIQWHAAHSVSLNESSLILDSESSHYMNPKCCNLTADENKHMHINLCKLKAIFDTDREKSHSDACLI